MIVIAIGVLLVGWLSRWSMFGSSILSMNRAVNRKYRKMWFLYFCLPCWGQRVRFSTQKMEIKFLHLAQLGFVEACWCKHAVSTIYIFLWDEVSFWAFVFFINLVSLTVSTPDKASDGIGPKKGSRGNQIGQGWNKERWRAQLLFEALQKRRSTNIGGSSRHSL